MKSPHYGFIFKPPAKYLIMLFYLLSLAITANAVDANKPPVPVEGRLAVTGSVALSNLMTYWTQAFSQRNPLVTVTIADPGGTAGIAALINGIADIALTRTPIIGVIGPVAQQPISVYGLTVSTGTNSLFRETALCGGDFIKNFQALAGPAAVVNALISDSAGIGFSSSSMTSSGIHMLAIAPHKDALAIAPTPDAIRSGQYPISRTLGIAINQPRNQPLSPVLQAFIKFVLSPEGQSIAAKAGYVSLP